MADTLGRRHTVRPCPEGPSGPCRSAALPTAPDTADDRLAALWGVSPREASRRVRRALADLRDRAFSYRRDPVRLERLRAMLNELCEVDAPPLTEAELHRLEADADAAEDVAQVSALVGPSPEGKRLHARALERLAAVAGVFVRHYRTQGVL
jgi:hypothetical protein